MPHFLCFTDLSSACDNDNSSATVAVISPSQDAPSKSAAAREHQRPTALFAREENKKSSFVLPEPLSLNERSSRNSDYDNDDGSPCNEATAGGGKEGTVVSEASITSCVSQIPPQLAPLGRETFFFGGFELVTNVKTVKVVRQSGEASHFTTCRGVRVRDMPPLATPPLYLDGTEGGGTSNGTPCVNEASKQNEGDLDESVEQDLFYKFVFVSPGGARRVDRSVLKFVRDDTSSVCAKTIVVRSLKLKGRLSDSIPASNAAHQPRPQLPLLDGTATSHRGGTSGLASMMAMMGGESRTGMHMVAPVGSQRQQHSQWQRQQFQQQIQQQQTDQSQEKKHAEIMASVAGLGIFMKSSEERTMNKLESLLANMETRIMGRLDVLTERLDALEQSMNASTNEHGKQDRHRSAIVLEKNIDDCECHHSAHTV